MPQTIRIETRTYAVYGLPQKISEDDTAAFDELFYQSAQKLFAEYDVPLPLDFTVALAADADEFLRLTASPWFTAAMYRAETGRVLFSKSPQFKEARYFEAGRTA